MTGSTSTHTETHAAPKKGGKGCFYAASTMLVIMVAAFVLLLMTDGYTRWPWDSPHAHAPAADGGHPTPPPVTTRPPNSPPADTPVRDVQPHRTPQAYVPQSPPEVISEEAEDTTFHEGCPTHIHIDNLPYGPDGQAIADRLHWRLCTHGGYLEGIEDGYTWHADWDPP